MIGIDAAKVSLLAGYSANSIQNGQHS